MAQDALLHTFERLLGLFAVAVTVAGGWRGVRSLIALALTLAVIVKIVVPLILAGWGNGTLKPGRMVRYPDETPITNLYVAMLDRMGVPVEALGDSTEKLGYLSDL